MTAEKQMIAQRLRDIAREHGQQQHYMLSYDADFLCEVADLIYPAPHPEPLEGYLVRGREVLTALMVWESPVDEPPSVSAGYETYSLPYWRGRGWQWYNKHPRDDADPSDSDIEEPL